MPKVLIINLKKFSKCRKRCFLKPLQVREALKTANIAGNHKEQNNLFSELSNMQ